MSGDDDAPEPHPLPLTRQWVEDYKRYASKPDATEEQPKPTIIPLDATGCPDLQALIERAGRRYVASIGEEWVEDVVDEKGNKYPPLDEKGNLKRPARHGGYPHITVEEWAEYDRAMANWQARKGDRA